MRAQRFPLTEEELDPPSDVDVERALAAFSTAVRARYGAMLAGLYLFGSRSRGDHRPNSDADVAVVLRDGDWADWRERRALTGLAYEPSMEFGVLIQPWPIRSSDWGLSAVGASNLAKNALRDARPIGAQ